MPSKFVSFSISMLALGSLFLGNSCGKDKDDKPAVNAWAIGNGNELYSFNLNSASNFTVKGVTGLQAGEIILAIDIRPATSELYGLGSSSRIYKIDKNTAVATQAGAAPFDPVLSGSSFGFDFNPMVDRIRVISNTDLNFRLHPETGALAGMDIAITPGGASISAAAYTNNSAGAASSELYVLDAATDKLYKMASPNNGILTEVGSLGIDADNNNGFDIGGKDNKAFALLNTGGTASLYSIDLTTGTATKAGSFPVTVKGLAISPSL